MGMWSRCLVDWGLCEVSYCVALWRAWYTLLSLYLLARIFWESEAGEGLRPISSEHCMHDSGYQWGSVTCPTYSTASFTGPHSLVS
jgi:hypothetical protein